jgi:hypothetical protein
MKSNQPTFMFADTSKWVFFLTFIYFLSDKSMGGKQSLIKDEDLDDYQVSID